MPFDSNGVFSRVMNWTSDQQNGIAIECGRHDAEDNNFAEGFNETFCRDGRAAATGNFNLGNHKIQNLADGIAATDAVTKGQLDASSAAGVSLNTVQTITGEKTFTKEITEKVNMTKGTAPAASMYPKPYKINDSADSMVGNIQFTYGQNMSAGLGMLVYNCNDTTDSTPAALQVFNNNGVKYATCPDPTDTTSSTNSTQIPTVGWGNTHYVTLDTAQTITGTKTFTQNLNVTKNTASINLDNSNFKQGTPPASGEVDSFVIFRDQNQVHFGGLKNAYLASGTSYTSIFINKHDGSETNSPSISINCNSDNVGYATCPQPIDTTSTSSNQIATVGFVNGTSHNLVHKSGTETIAGIKTFTDNIKFYDTILVRYNSDSNFGGFIRAQSESVRYGTMDGGSGTWNSGYLDLHKDYVTTVASDVANSIVTTVSKSKAANGYFQLGNGLIVQWGYKANSGTHTVTVTLPKAFTTTNYAVTASRYKNEWAEGVMMQTNNYKTTSFDLTVNEPGAHWIAIGY